MQTGRDASITGSILYRLVEKRTGDAIMLTKVEKWGDGLALRIPKAFAVDAQLENDSLVEISIVKGKIVITPVSVPGWTLDELLAGVTTDNLHTEVDTGFAVGNEVW